MLKLGVISFGLSLMASVATSVVVHAAGMETSAKFAYILDFDTGKTLFEKNSEQLMSPASMSKLMTVYMVFEQLKAGKIKLEDEFVISQVAFDRRGSSMFAQLKSKVSINNLLKGIIVVSGNDASIAIAEGLAGDEATFAQQMQAKAREIGLTKSTFANSTGWPDKKQQMTMHDLGRLAYVIMQEFPEYYHYFGQERFKWGKTDQPNRNILLDDNIGVDGLKTGRTEESGYGIVTSAVNGDRRVIVVLNGLDSSRKLAAETRRLIDWAFNAFEKYKIYDGNTVIGYANVAGGMVDEIELMPNEDIVAFLNTENYGTLDAKIVYNSPLVAPISTIDEIAQLHISSEDGFEHIVPLYAQKDVAKSTRVDQSIDILWSWVDKKLNSLF